ncbi:hypothetical protein [Clostridium sp. JNZ J1-5]
MKKENSDLNRVETTMNGTSIDNPKINSSVNQCPQPSNQTNMTIATNCPGYEPVVSSSMMNGECTVSCNSCRNFKDNKCVVNLYDKVLARIDDSK